jgi:cholesterol transport system auxiliary component
MAAPRVRVPAAILLCGLLLACSTPPAMVRYDFGVPAPAGTAAPTGPADYTAAGIEVLAPPWLDTPAVLYRLSYADESQLHAYAQSQWVAPPARLLELALRQAGSVHRALSCGGSGTREAAAAAATAQVVVDLEEFSQVFEAAQSSHVVLRARVRLLAARTRALVAQREFDLRSAAISPDAPGAVHGLRDLGRAFAADALTWAAAQALRPCDPPH